jgi:hypothetical protein
MPAEPMAPAEPAAPAQPEPPIASEATEAPTRVSAPEPAEALGGGRKIPDDMTPSEYDTRTANTLAQRLERGNAMMNGEDFRYGKPMDYETPADYAGGEPIPREVQAGVRNEYGMALRDLRSQPPEFWDHLRQTSAEFQDRVVSTLRRHMDSPVTFRDLPTPPDAPEPAQLGEDGMPPPDETPTTRLGDQPPPDETPTTKLTLGEVPAPEPPAPEPAKPPAREYAPLVPDAVVSSLDTANSVAQNLARGEAMMNGQSFRAGLVGQYGRSGQYGPGEPIPSDVQGYVRSQYEKALQTLRDQPPEFWSNLKTASPEFQQRVLSTLLRNLEHPVTFTDLPTPKRQPAPEGTPEVE